jgi:hypothetical protein
LIHQQTTQRLWQPYCSKPIPPAIYQFTAIFLHAIRPLQLFTSTISNFRIDQAIITLKQFTAQTAAEFAISKLDQFFNIKIPALGTGTVVTLSEILIFKM